MNEQRWNWILIHLKQVLYDFFNFLGFDFFQNICSQVSSPLEQDFPWWNRLSRTELKGCAFCASSVSIKPSAPGRGPLCFSLAPNVALKSLLFYLAFFFFFCKSQVYSPVVQWLGLGMFTARAWVWSLIRKLKIPQIMQCRGGGSHFSLAVFISLFVTVIITLIIMHGLVDHLNLFF